MSIDPIDKYPDISYIDNITLSDVQEEMIKDFQDKYFGLTGKKLSLSQSDPSRLVLYACALQIYQAMQYIDNAGKQNTLKYAYGDYLENIGAWKGIQRSQGTYAKTVIRFTLSKEQTSVISIPAGTRVTAGDDIYFSTDETAEILIGQLSIDARATCSVIGDIKYDIGEINVLVDPIPFMQSVENITKAEGGSDIESDESLAQRIFLAPSSYSVAGPDDAYIYWAKTYNPNILDVKVSSPKPVEVDIRFILGDGDIPGETTINALQTYLSDKKIRPLTDHVQVSAPDIVTYTIDVSYWINDNDRSIASTIQGKVNEAIENYKRWQRSKIGRDINPSVLHQMIMSAGAKRAEVISPQYQSIPATSVAYVTDCSIRYGGMESD